MAQRTCSIEGCDRSHDARGWCTMHYNRWKATGDPGPAESRYTSKRGQCTVDGCEKPDNAQGFCRMHYYRLKAHGDVGPAGRMRNASCEYVNGQGYVVVRDGTGSRGRRLQHRVVMEETLGRPLLPFENVHHKNGVKTDNRPENLEVWTKVQPCGQRPEDIVSWVVHYYADLVEAELKTHKREQQSGQLRLIV